MVRLFVPECESDHLLTRRRNNPLVTDSHVVDTPWRSTVGALGVSALLALVGRARPGTFLKTTAYLSTANIAISAFDMYGQREINRAIFKLDKVEHKPGKLWERTKHWTVEDVVIAGGILGMCLAINPGALPGVYGWKRFLGAATVGAALGGNVGETYVAGMVPEVRQAIQEIDDAHRNAQYDRLLAQPEALQSLSRFGRLAFVIHCLPEIRLPRFHVGDEVHVHQEVVVPITDEKDVPTYVVAEFNNGELKGPDLEHGSRSYKDDPPSWNVSELEEWLKSLQDHRNINAAEARYLWRSLAEREEQFYKMREDDREKDIVRRKLQLLDNVSSERVMKDALLAYHIADTRKRLEQARNNGRSTQEPLLSHEIVKLGPTDGAVGTFDFQNFADSIEISWKRQRRDLAQTERHTNMLSKLTLEPGSPEEATFKEFKHQLEIKKKNFEATEKLLREFEELAQAASEKKRVEVSGEEKKE